MHEFEIIAWTFFIGALFMSITTMIVAEGIKIIILIGGIFTTILLVFGIYWLWLAKRDKESEKNFA